MKNYRYDGCAVTVTLAANTDSGDVVIQGSLIGIAVTSGLSGEDIAINLEGAYLLPKATGVAFTQGDRLLWDISSQHLTKTTASDTVFFGLAFEDAASGATECITLLERDGFEGLPQATVTPVGTLTVANATGNTTGDLNGVKDAITTHLNTLGGKVDALIAKLEAAGLLL
jgi:predicted RecA/RadA family phage recombinase